jgi:hypothetical protein
MKILQSVAVTALAVCLLAVYVSSHNVVSNVPYVAAFAPLHSQSYPYSGNMRLNFNQGIISGSYTDTSIRPGGPLAQRMKAPVVGGVDAQGNIHFTIGPLSFHGTLRGPWITGTANARGRFWNFQAKQGMPGKPLP